MDIELVDIMLFATPKKWQHDMDQMGIDPMEKTSIELLRFMESCEAMENFDNSNTTVACKGNMAKRNTNKGSPPNDPKKYKWRNSHRWSNHTTAECNQNKPGLKSGKNGDTKLKAKTRATKLMPNLGNVSPTAFRRKPKRTSMPLQRSTSSKESRKISTPSL
jgi:hypothetical protein